MAGSPQFPKLRGDDVQQSRTQDNIANQLGPVARALAATPIMGSPPPPWIAPSLGADFINVTGQAAAGYHRDALGYVHGKGAVSTAAGQAAGTTIYTIARGYRPKEIQRLSVRGAAGAVQAVTISPAGLVANDLIIAAAGTIDLAFSFLAEQ